MIVRWLVNIAIALYILGALLCIGGLVYSVWRGA